MVIPNSSRRLQPSVVTWLVVTGVACIGVVTIVGLRLHDVRGAVSLDVRTARPVFDRVFGIPLVPVRLARAYQQLGNPPDFAVLLLLLAGAGVAMRDRLVMWSAVIGPVAAELFSEAFGKPVFNRTDAAGFDSFPSSTRGRGS